MGVYDDHGLVRRGNRAVRESEFRYGRGMVFPPSWATDSVDEPERDEFAPSQCQAAGCDGRHDGLESLSEHVREQMLASLERDGDPKGLLLAYRRYLSTHRVDERREAA